MTVCEDGHDEIVYDGRNCPFFYYISKTKTELEDLNQQINENEKRISELEKIK